MLRHTHTEQVRQPGNGQTQPGLVAPNSIVRVNGADRPTMFLNETQLLAKLIASDVAAGGDKSITVFTPTPGGGASNILTLAVLAPGALPIPAVSQINVQGALAGSGPITVEVQGSDFAPNAIVQFNGLPRSTTCVNSQTLLAQLIASDLAQPGLGAITVQNTGALQDSGAFENALQTTTNS